MGKESGAYMDQSSPPSDDGDILVIEVDGKATPMATEAELNKRRGKRHNGVFRRGPRSGFTSSSTGKPASMTVCPRSFPRRRLLETCATSKSDCGKWPGRSMARSPPRLNTGWRIRENAYIQAERSN